MSGLWAKVQASQAVGGAAWHICKACDFDVCDRCFAAAAAGDKVLHEHPLLPQDPAMAEGGHYCDLCKAGDDQGDLQQALYWANRAIAILTAASGGAPTAELAAGYEMVAWLLLNPGPNFNLAASEKMAAHALQLRRACGAEEGSNETLQESVAEWKESKESGAIDAHGLALGAALLAGAALAEGEYEDGDGEEGGGGLFSKAKSAFGKMNEAVGEMGGDGETLTEKIFNVENLEKVVDFFSMFF